MSQSNPEVGWYALNPLWEGGEDVVEKGLPHEELAPAWQIMLLGDLSPTRHLKLLTGEPIAVDVIDLSPIGSDPDGIPELIRDIPVPRIRRQVWLCTASGQRLGYASSWWDAGRMDAYLQEKSIPIWDNLVRLRTELYRDIRKIQYGDSFPLEEAFDQKGPFWGRYYFFFYQQKPLTLIYEVFSPYLDKYLGRCRSFSYIS
jgi:chorismate lyase